MSELNRFRTINKIEGYSYLVLLFIAMPFKYAAGIAMATKVFGMIHGLLFILFCYQLYVIWQKSFISRREAIYYFILSLVPFGSFHTDRLLKSRLKIDPISIKDF